MKIKEMPKIKIRNQVALSSTSQRWYARNRKPRAQHRRNRQDTKQQLKKGVW